MRKKKKDENPSNRHQSPPTPPHDSSMSWASGFTGQYSTQLEFLANGQPIFVPVVGTSDGILNSGNPLVGVWTPGPLPKSNGKLWLPGGEIDIPTVWAEKAVAPSRKGLFAFAAVAIGNFRAAVAGRAVLEGGTRSALPDFPRIWELAAYLLDHKTRRDVYAPSIEELKEDYCTTRRKYRTKWARRWLRFSFAIRTIALFFSCFRNMIVVVIRFLLLCWLPAPARTAVERILHLN
jgi:hypothetical protein